MKKKILTGITALVLIALLAVGLMKQITDYNSVINANWGFNIPRKAHYEEIYSKDSGSSFHGDGIRYHVFSYENEEPVSEMFFWGENNGPTRFHDHYQQAACDWLTEISVPIESYPDFQNCHYAYFHGPDDPRNEIIILWNSEADLLHICESFM